jgi:hypothetical protein
MVSGYKVNLSPVVANNEENAKFFHYTPAGNIELSLVNEETAKTFVPGKSYYVDFTEAE